MLRSLRQAGSLRLGLILATLAGFVVALALAACPELHERLHHEADEHGQHECLATLLAAGGCDSVEAEPPALEFTGALLAEPAAEYGRTVGSLFLSFRILEHAPPVGA